MKKNVVKQANNIKAVLFDLDGVVADSMKHHAHAWIQILHKYGLDLVEVDIYKREGMTGLASVKQIFEEKGMPVPHDLTLNEIIKEKHTFFKGTRIDLYPLVISIIDYLTEKGYSLALVTGSPKIAVEHILPSELIKKFKVIISADDVNFGKPSPEPYEKALRNLNLKTEEAFVIENAPMGILSAKNAGLTCFAIETTLSKEYLHQADVIVKNHDDLFSLLKNNY